jgi:hypothetical protein
LPFGVFKVVVFTKPTKVSLAECEHNWRADKERKEIKRKNISEKVTKKKNVFEEK